MDDIRSVLEPLALPPDTVFSAGTSAEVHPRLVYVLVELVGNAVEAHRLTDKEEPVKLVLEADEKGLLVEVQDSADCFPANGLPCTMEQYVMDVSLLPESLDEYAGERGPGYTATSLRLASRLFNRMRIDPGTLVSLQLTETGGKSS